MYTRSKKLFDESKKTLAAGVSSNLRLAMEPVPLFIKEAIGNRMIDEDDNEYIDYIQGYGPQILGHSHPDIVEAIKTQVEIGQTYGMQHQNEIDLSQKVTELLPSADLVSFCSTGTEAVQLAFRLSRAHTGRQKIVRFDGHYHGWVDSVNITFSSGSDEESYLHPKTSPSTAGQNPKALEDVIVLPWNNFEALEETMEKHGDEIAAIITEPVMCNSGCISPLPGYLEKMRELTKKHGTVLIFDEVITGFRLGLGSAQGKLKITPDLTTLGKAVAGGMPLSVLAGKKEIMSLIAENKVNHMGTLNGNSICSAAAIASLNYLSKDDGAIYDQMEHVSTLLIEGLQDLATQHGIPLLINRNGPVFHTMFTTQDKVESFYGFQQRDVELFNRFAEALLHEGVLVRPSGLWYISTVHTEDDIKETLKKAEKAFQSMEK